MGRRAQQLRRGLARIDADWPIGSYFDFYLATVPMMFVWLATLSIRNEFASLPENIDIATGFLLTYAASAGWMMLIAAGVAFEIYPLIHGNAPFSPSIIRITISTNISGQVLIYFAHSQIGNGTWFYDLALLGVLMLTISLCLVSAPMWSIKKAASHTFDKSGISGILPGLVLPVIGIGMLISWILFNIGSPYWYQGMLIVMTFYDCFWILLALAVGLGHLNRRLDWNLFDLKRDGWKSGVLFALLIAYIVLMSSHILTGGTTLSNATIPLILALLWTMYTLRPIELIRMVLKRAPHSATVISGVFWLPVVAFVAYFDTKNGIVELNNTRILLLFAVGFQCLIGTAIYLHHDHLHLPEKERRAHWLIHIPLLGSLLCFSLPVVMPSGTFSDIQVAVLDKLQYVFLAIMFAVWSIWWLFEAFLKIQNWHRIPMFYSSYLSDLENDPYELED